MTRRFFPWGVLGAALALTLVAAALLHRSAKARADEAFRNAVEATRDRIEAQVQVYTALLRGTAGLLVSAEGPLTADEFRSYIERIGVAQHYPGIQGIGFSRRLEARDMADLRAQWDAAGLTSVRPWPDTLGPDVERHAIAYLEPLDVRNRAALGFNMHSEATRRAAMNLARDTGEPAVSGRVRLVQETHGPPQAGFLLYMPVYFGGVVPSTVAERREWLCGFAYAPFRADDLFDNVFGSEQTPRTAFKIYDGTPDAAHLLYDSATNGIVLAPASVRRDTTSLALYGRSWTVTFAPTEALYNEFQARGAQMVLGAGLLLSLVLFGLALAQQREAEARHARERELDALVNALPQLVWWADADGRTSWNNRPWRPLLGGDLSDAPDAWTAAVKEDEREQVQAALAEARAQGNGWEQIVRFADRLDGSPRWFLSQVVPVRGLDGQVLRWFGAHTDVTAQYVAREADARAFREQLAREAAEAREADLQRYAHELERSNRELQEFAYIASHDLQEPLRKIQTFSDLIRLDASDRLGEEDLHALGRIQSAAGRMSQLIKDLLAFSRVSQGEFHPEPVALSTVVENVRNDLYVRLDETGGTVEAGPLPTVEGHPTHLHQLLLNLVGNGLKFHRRGVPPHVTVQAEPLDLPSPNGPRPGVRLRVSDNGIGIEEKHLGRIFAPFQRLHRPGTYEGTGIGLSVCRNIAERHGGRIEVESTPGVGTTFLVDLPLRQEVVGASGSVAVSGA